MPAPIMDRDSDDSDDAASDNELAEELTSVCPFDCAHESSDIQALFAHCRNEHSFDFTRTAQGLDIYDRMRLVNYIRTHHPTASQIADNKKDWAANDLYLKPVIPDDPLLFEFPDELLDHDESNDVALLKHQLIDMTREFAQYKISVRDSFLNNNQLSQLELNNPIVPAAGEIDESYQLDYYFGSYAETQIHETMLKDRIRTDAYRDFIYNNKDIFRDKIVLDVGCGTGILSMFCAKAGAKKVYAVDNSTIITKARDIALENGLDSKITFIQGKIEEIVLPTLKVDIILSEWMGYFLLYEGMLDSVIYARDKWLAKDGLMVPATSNIRIAALSDEEWINESYDFWNNVYGFKMSVMKTSFTRDAQVDFVDGSKLVSNVAVIKNIDMQVDSCASLDFDSEFCLIASRDCRVHAIAGWFDVLFDKDVIFRTGPMNPRTHWKQTSFVLDVPLDVKTGDSLFGTLRCIKATENHRELDVFITITVSRNDVMVTAEKTQKFRVA